MSDTIIAAIIAGIISLIVGFWGGKTYESHKKIKLIQKAGKNSNQTQIGIIKDGGKKESVIREPEEGQHKSMPAAS